MRWLTFYIDQYTDTSLYDQLTDFGLSKIGLINSAIDLSGSGTNGARAVDTDNMNTSFECSHERDDRSQEPAVGTPDYLAPEILLGTEHGLGLWTQSTFRCFQSILII